MLGEDSITNSLLNAADYSWVCRVDQMFYNKGGKSDMAMFVRVKRIMTGIGLDPSFARCII